MKASLIISSFNRPHLLRLGLSSVCKSLPSFDLDVIVVNDGLEDGTKEVCDSFCDKLDVKYVFSGRRHLDGIIKSRVSGFALNIGVKQSSGDIIILSCPEIYHLNNSISTLVNGLLTNPRSMSIPEYMYFDYKNIVTTDLLIDDNDKIDFTKLESGENGKAGVTMPFLMAMYRKEFEDIGGYDEDFTGYACEDNDLVERLKDNGLNYLRTTTQIIHLWHPGHNNGQVHYDNPRWVYNYNLLTSRKGKIIRNEGRKWGQIE